MSRQDNIVSVRAISSKQVPGKNVDPLTTALVRNSLGSIAEKMKVSLQRTGFSEVIYDGIDYACAIFDHEFRLLAQARTFPLFLGTLGLAAEAIVRKSGGEESLEPGDVMFSSYSYDTGSHANDAVTVLPVFFKAELVGYVAIKAHQSDIGGKDPYITDSTDNFQEGTIYPGIKIYKADQRQEDIFRIMLANSRLPQNFEGDMNAVIGAARGAVSGLISLIEKHGKETFFSAAESMFDHAEVTVRHFIEQIPDGRYLAHGSMDNDGLSDDPVPFEIAIEIKGSDIVVDFTNSPPQTRGPINSPLAATVSAARFVVSSIAGQGGAVCEGHFRAIEVRLRQNTFFCSSPPAPCFLCLWPGIQVIDVIQKALSDILPEGIRAGSGGDVGAGIFWGTQASGDFWVNGVDHPCGQGAKFDGDGGAPTLHLGMSGEQTLSTEIWEARYPEVLLEKYELAPDSCGPGQWRGGLGVNIHYHINRESSVTVVMDRCKTAPWGLYGGGDGRPNSFWLRHPDGTKSQHYKSTALSLEKDEVAEFCMGGGGGYGPQEKRDRNLILEDIKDGYTSEGYARKYYPHAFE